MPKVSVIIPTFNSEKYIRETLESAVYQTLEDIEIIIADCESKDKTLEIIDEYAKNDSRIKVLHRPLEFVGLSRNAALDVATGDYIMFLDSDDMLVPEACEEAYNQISQNDNDLVIFDICEYIEDTGKKRYSNSKLKLFTKNKNGKSFKLFSIETPFLTGAESWYRIYKREFLNQNNIRFSEEKFCEDIPFSFKSYVLAKSVSILNKPLYIYRIVNTSSTTSCALNYWKDVLTTRLKAYECILASSHSCVFIKIFASYFINSIIYWYRRWSKIKGFPKQEYYEEMHKFFATLRKRHSAEILAVKGYINDYNFYKMVSKHNWTEYRLLLILKPIFSITPENTHNVIRLLGFKIKIRRKPEQLRKQERYAKIYKKHSKYYAQNLKRIIEKTQNGEKIRVAFYVNDSKWKTQHLFELMQQSEAYEPFVLVGKNNCERGHYEFQEDEEIKDIYNNFTNQGMEAYYAYDFENQEHVPFENFDIDILFYSRQFLLNEKYDIAEAAKKYLTCYVPYFVPNSPKGIETNYLFHNSLWKHFILNEETKREYSMVQAAKGQNLVPVGYPAFECYLKDTCENKDFVIYAPHWSLGNTPLKYATFDWNGKEILEFAKSHPEIKWIFKPHPVLKGRIVEVGLMTEEEVEEYWNEWDKIGIKYEGPDYLDLFKQSKAMITDCGSFLAEYMPTKNPVILLRSKKATPYNFLAQKVTKFYYSVWNLEQLEEQLNKVVLQNRDPWKERRLAMLDELQLVNNASQNILEDLSKEFGIE